MKIAALINIVPNIEQLSKNEWNINNINSLDTNYIPKTYDIYNDTILEMLLRYKSEIKNDINTNITLLSVNNSNIDYYLKTFYSYNIDNIIRIERENPLLINSDIISDDIYTLLKDLEEFDIILAGKRGMLNSSGLTGYKVANKLYYNVINNVIAIHKCNSAYCAEVTYIENNEIIREEIKFPFLGLVSDVPQMFLQIPSLKQKIKGKKKSIEVISLKNEDKDSKLKVYDENCSRENQSRNGIYFKHNSPNKTIKYLETFIKDSKKESLGNNSLLKYYCIDNIYIFKCNDINIYFCFNDNHYYNEFIKWNIKDNNKLFLNSIDISLNNNEINIKRKIYAENLVSDIKLDQNSLLNRNNQKILSLCGNKELLNKILSLVNKQGEISTYLIDKLKLEKEFSNHTTIIEKKKIYSIDNIKNEKVVIAIGIGIKNRKNLKAIEDFAKNNNLIIVGTRQAAMNNFIPLENMVGVSNKQIKPNLLICIGLSGAPAFFEGVKKSKKIISINNDINAPIMENSDIKINEDVEKIFN